MRAAGDGGGATALPARPALAVSLVRKPATLGLTAGGDAGGVFVGVTRTAGCVVGVVAGGVDSVVVIVVVGVVVVVVGGGFSDDGCSQSGGECPR